MSIPYIYDVKMIKSQQHPSKNMMKTILFITAFCFSAFVLHAADPSWSVQKSLAGKDATVRDASGRIVTTTSSSGDNTTFRDSSGRIVSTASASGSTSTTFRDASGRITSTASNNGSNTTYRDATGRITSTASTNGDSTTYRDSGTS